MDILRFTIHIQQVKDKSSLIRELLSLKVVEMVAISRKKWGSLCSIATSAPY